MRKVISIIEALLRRKEYFCLAPFERSFGDPGNQLFFGLIYAKRKGMKLVVIARKPTFFRKIVSRLKKDRLTNKEIFELECPGVIMPRQALIGYDFFAVLLDLLYIFFYVAKFVIYKLTGFDLFYNKAFKSVSVFEMPRFGQSVLVNPDRRRDFSWEAAKSYEWDRSLFEKYDIRLREDKQKAGEALRLQLGIPLADLFVCLHVRDTGFYVEDRRYAGFRSSSVTHFEKAVKAITRRGLWVLRIGDPRMIPAPFKNEKFIDYPFSKYKSDLLDLYFIKSCLLFIGTDSGPSAVATMFQKNTLYHNLTDWTIAAPVMHGDLCLIKYYYSRSRQRFLGIKEILEEPYPIISQFGHPVSETDEYVVVENTAEDIESVVEEKLNQGGDCVYSDLQNEFVQKRRVQCERLIATCPHYRSSLNAAYELAAKSNYRGTLGETFLRKNWEYGENLERMTQEFRRNNK